VPDPKTELSKFIAAREERVAQVNKDHRDRLYKIEVIRVEPFPMPNLEMLSRDPMADVKELRKITKEDMEKHGVEKDESKTKTASALTGTCAQCGGELTKEDGAPMEHCPVCGTEPFERKVPPIDPGP